MVPLLLTMSSRAHSGTVEVEAWGGGKGNGARWCEIVRESDARLAYLEAGSTNTECWAATLEVETLPGPYRGIHGLRSGAFWPPSG